MDESLEKLRQMQEKMPAYQEVLELAEKLWAAKQEAINKWILLPFPMDKENIKKYGEAGFPYGELAEIPFDLTQTEKYFYHLLEIFNQHMLEICNQHNSPKYEALCQVMAERKFAFIPFFNQLRQGMINEESLFNAMGLEGSLLFFFAIQALRPTLELYAQQWRKERGEEFLWPYGYCPFCGGYASLGEIKEEGQKVLHCGLCSTEWNFPRLKCPYCPNENQEKLSYFQVAGEIGNRVDVCLLCRHYLKTIDSRDRIKPVDWEIEDYLTLYLDLLAQEEGFLRPAQLFVQGK